MAGIYIHVPFCRQACRYCDFYFTVSLKYRDMYVDALLKEICESPFHAADREERIETIYFGGGTPSVLEKKHIKKILKLLKEEFDIHKEVECTLEANPDDLDRTYLEMLREAGFNRLSVGIQSFREEDLELMRRSHSVKQAMDCLKDAREVGFQNINIDLIYGIPGLNTGTWTDNLKFATQQDIQHISAYHLTFEEGTVFKHMLKKGKLTEVTEDVSIEQYELLKNITAGAGFEHYEISNFARPGFKSKHNSSYWQGKNYYGFGPAAHSYNGIERKWNISNLMKYVEGVNNKVAYFDIEELSENERYNEYLIISLRTSEGINLKQIKESFGKRYLDILDSKVGEYILSGDLVLDEDRIFMTSTGWLRSDGIIEALMV